MVNDYILAKVLDKIKETVGIVKFDDTKFLIDTDDKMPEYITLKNIVILCDDVIVIMLVLQFRAQKKVG